MKTELANAFWLCFLFARSQSCLEFSSTVHQDSTFMVMNELDELALLSASLQFSLFTFFASCHSDGVLTERLWLHNMAPYMKALFRTRVVEMAVVVAGVL